MEHIHVCVIQTDLLNYIVKSLNLDCVPALTNVNVSKLSWKLEDMAFIASIYYIDTFSKYARENIKSIV